MMRTIAIVACDEERGIGRAGGIPWHHPEDFRHFREATMGHPLVMGRLTVASLPKRLPGRPIVMVSASGVRDAKADAVARDVDEALERAALYATGKAFVAGGVGIYRDGLPFCHEALLTRVPGLHGCDAFFPGMPDGWRLGEAHARGGLTYERWTRS